MWVMKSLLREVAQHRSPRDGTVVEFEPFARGGDGFVSNLHLPAPLIAQGHLGADRRANGSQHSHLHLVR
jgi:hypothetical protein